MSADAETHRRQESISRTFLDYGPHVIISMMGPAFTHFDTAASYDGVVDTVERKSLDLT